MKETNQAINLLDQIIEKAREDDATHKKKNLQSKGSQTVGDDWYVFHLELLRGMLAEGAEKNS